MSGHIFEGRLSGNGLKDAVINGVMTPDLLGSIPSCHGQFMWPNSLQFKEGQYYELVLNNGSSFEILIKTVSRGSPCLVNFLAI
jgi:hypothetical protein